MILEFLADIFHLVKVLFGLGALLGLIGLGALLLWFAGHVVVRYALCHQPAERCSVLRKLFLEHES